MTIVTDTAIEFATENWFYMKLFNLINFRNLVIKIYSFIKHHRLVLSSSTYWCKMSSYNHFCIAQNPQSELLGS